MRLIDADALMEHAMRDRLDSRERIMEMIENAPTVETTLAVKVVGAEEGMTMAPCGFCGRDFLVRAENAVDYICPVCRGSMGME